MTYRIGTEFLHNSWPYTSQIFSLTKLHKLLLDAQQRAEISAWTSIISRERCLKKHFLWFRVSQMLLELSVWAHTSSARLCVCVVLSLCAYCVYVLHKRWWLTSEHTHILPLMLIFSFCQRGSHVGNNYCALGKGQLYKNQSSKDKATSPFTQTQTYATPVLSRYSVCQIWSNC